MKSTDPLFPYQNIFITARPGMGATTLALNIVNKYLDEGKKCLVSENTNCFYTNYIERAKVMREGIAKEITHPCFLEYGNLKVTYHYIFEIDCVLTAIESCNADVIVYEEPYYFRDQSKELIKLCEELKRRGKIFIFVTHLKKKNGLFSCGEKITPSASRHRRAISCFDATAIVYRNGYYNEVEEVTEEIRIYERGKKKYTAVPVEFDFQHQRVKRK